MMFATHEYLHYLDGILQERGVSAYITGGFIRNTLMGFATHDVDICGAATPSQMDALLKDSPVTVVGVAPDFGTVLLCYTFEGERYKLEYTTFRCDSYPRGGAHRPESVVFTDDMGVDATRRDFTINAMYCPLAGGDILDPTGGLADLRARVLRATSDPPDEVMRQDGLRILRLARQACSMGLTIDPGTFAAARRMRDNIRGIAAERIRVELEKILLADTAYGIPDAHVAGLRLLDELDTLNLALPELNREYIGDCAHTPPELTIRLAALLKNTGAEAARERLNALTFPKRIIRRVCVLIENYSLDDDGGLLENDLRLAFVRLGAEAVGQLIALRSAMGEDMSRFTELLGRMRRENAPFTLAELNVNGNDLMKHFALTGRAVGETMRRLWREAVIAPEINTREQLLKKVPNP